MKTVNVKGLSLSEATRNVAKAKEYSKKAYARFRASPTDENADKLRQAAREQMHAVAERLEVVKKSRKKTTVKKSSAKKPRTTLTVHELVSELAKALSTEVAPDERRRITLRVSTAKQANKRKPNRKARRRPMR